MEQMTIDDILQEKMALTEQLFTLIEVFEAKTHVTIHDIQVNRLTTRISQKTGLIPTSSILTSVDVDIRL